MFGIFKPFQSNQTIQQYRVEDVCVCMYDIIWPNAFHRFEVDVC